MLPVDDPSLRVPRQGDLLLAMRQELDEADSARAWAGHAGDRILGQCFRRGCGRDEGGWVETSSCWSTSAEVDPESGRPTLITIGSSGKLDEQKKLGLIDSISRATNSQTAVTNADRRSNVDAFKQIQQRAFQLLGFFLERKRGEFSDGVSEGYIAPGQIVDCAWFLRAAFLEHGALAEVRRKKIAAVCDFETILDVDDGRFTRYGLALFVLNATVGTSSSRRRLDSRSTWIAYISLLLLTSKGLTEEFHAIDTVARVRDDWGAFEATGSSRFVMTPDAFRDAAMGFFTSQNQSAATPITQTLGDE